MKYSCACPSANGNDVSITGYAKDSFCRVQNKGTESSVQVAGKFSFCPHARRSGKSWRPSLSLLLPTQAVSGVVWKCGGCGAAGGGGERGGAWRDTRRVRVNKKL